MKQTQQIDTWTGEFGKAYTDRNTFSDANDFHDFYIKRYGANRTSINASMLSKLDKNIKILEVGTNIGNQLDCLHGMGFCNLYGIEIQEQCVQYIQQTRPFINIKRASAFDIPYPDGFFDLVFTNNVLIHISPKDIENVMKEMIRVTSRYIWGFEYYAPNYVEINYRGNNDLLWKSDFAKEFTKRFENLRIIDEKIYNCMDEVGLSDKMYLLAKT